MPTKDQAATLADSTQTPSDFDHLEARGRLGVVSNPISFSENVKFVIPINFYAIPSQSGKDVVFVYDRHIEWKRIDAHGDMMHITSEVGFVSSIQAARTLGSHELNDPRAQSQCLVLTLSSREIVFVQGQLGKDGKAYLSKVSRALPSSSDSVLEEVGKYLVVDPSSRALAIGAALDTLVLCTTTPHNIIQSTGSNPIKGMLVLNTKLILLNVQFVTSVSHNEMVHLLVVGMRNGKLRRTVYHWIPSPSMRPVDIETHEAVFDSLRNIPEIVAPLDYEGAVAMIVGETLTVYTGCDSSEGLLSLSTNLSLPDLQPASRRSQPWTNLSHLTLNQKAVAGIGLLAVGRADGLIIALRIMYDATDRLIFSKQYSYAQTHCDIDTAFAALQFEQERPVMFIIGGSSLSAGVFSTESSLESLATAMDEAGDDPVFTLRKTCNFNIQYPCNDACMVYRDRGVGDQDDPVSLPFSRNPDADLFVTSGKTSDGAISKVRYGTKANITMNLENEEFVGVGTLWALPSFFTSEGMSCHAEDDVGIMDTNSQAKLEVFVLSLPDFNVSMALHMDEPIIHEFDETRLYDLATLTNVNFSVEADRYAGSITVQVSSEGIRLLQVNDINPFLHRTNFFWPHSNVKSALIDPANGLIIYVQGDDKNAYLCMKHVCRNTNGRIELITVANSIKTFEDVTALCFHSLNAQAMSSVGNPQTELCSVLYLVLIGSGTGRLQIFRGDSEKGLLLLLELQLAHELDGDPGTACESIAVINISEMSDQSHRFGVLCGMRNGDMQTIICDYTSHNRPVSLRKIDHQTDRVGRTPVHLVRKAHTDSQALLYCGNHIFEASFQDEGSVQRSQVTSIWLVDASCPSYDHSEIYALSRCYSQDRQIACISSTSFLLARLETHAQVSLSRHMVSGTPKKLLYSRHLQCFVVSFVHTPKTSLGSDDVLLHSSLCLMRATHADTTNDLDQALTVIASFNNATPGEQYTRIIEFLFENGPKKFYRLIAASELTQQGSPKTGYLRYFDVSKSQSLRMVKGKPYAAPIYSLTQCEMSGLCFCCGKMLKYQTFSFQENRFLTKDNYLLPSPAIYLTCEGPFVYATTANDSIMIFEIVNERLRLMKSDDNPRSGITHATLDMPGIVMVSDRTNHVVGVWKPQTEKSGMETVCFEMTLSSPMIKILQLGDWSRSLKDVPGLLHGNIIGLGLDGSWTAFCVVSVSCWRLMKFVQNLYEFDQIGSTSTQNHRLHKEHIEPQGKSPKDFHVDGLLLRGLVNQPNAVTIVQRLLNKDPNLSGLYSDFATASDRRERFRQLADGAIVSVTTWNPGDSGYEDAVEESGIVKNVLCYIRCVLSNPL